MTENLIKARAAWAAMSPDERRARRAERQAMKAERAERAKRRAILGAEREARRAARIRRHQLHEAVQSQGIQAPESAGPSYQALRAYQPLAFCESCRRMMRQDLMAKDGLCIDCREPEDPLRS